MDNNKQIFKEMAIRVRRRIDLRLLLHVLNRVAMIPFIFVIVLMIAMRFLGIRCYGLKWFLGAFTVWMIIMVFQFLRKHVSEVRALALWDKITKRNELFLSAYCFEKKGERITGYEVLHNNYAAQLADKEVVNIRHDFPVEKPYGVVPLFMCLLFVNSNLLLPELPSDQQGMSKNVIERTKSEANELQALQESLKNLKKLTQEEQRKVSELSKSINNTIKKLSNSNDSSTPREMMEALEKEARNAEKLAETIKGNLGKKLSPEMLSTMEKQPDLSAMASALKNGNYNRAAKEFKKLSSKISGKNATIEQKRRLLHSFNKSLSSANSADKQTRFYKGLSSTASYLKQGQFNQAGKTLRKMGANMQRTATRNATAARLANIASRLRTTGSKIQGQNTATINKMAGSSRNRKRHSGPSRKVIMSTLSRQQLNQNSNKNLFASISNSPSANSGTPIPGLGNLPKNTGMSGRMPIPGSSISPGKSGTGMSGAAMQGGNKGGLQAGIGSAAYNPDASKGMKATGTGIVEGKDSGKGARSVTQLMSNSTPNDNEQASAKNKNAVLNKLKTEEESLNAEQMPLSRHQQIIRYFKSIRNKLE